MTELAIQQQAIVPGSRRDDYAFAQVLAKAGMLPRQYRDSPGDVLVAMEYARALRVPLAQVWTSINVIDGRPSMSAELMRALVLAAGHRVTLRADQNSATCTITRRDDPTPQSFTYTLDDARRAELLGKSNWKKDPRAMLIARASSVACRAVCPDVLAGVSYTPEELGDEISTAPAPQPTIVEQQRPEQQTTVDDGNGVQLAQQRPEQRRPVAPKDSTPDVGDWPAQQAHDNPPPVVEGRWSDLQPEPPMPTPPQPEQRPWLLLEHEQPHETERRRDSMLFAISDAAEHDDELRLERLAVDADGMGDELIATSARTAAAAVRDRVAQAAEQKAATRDERPAVDVQLPADDEPTGELPEQKAVDADGREIDELDRWRGRWVESIQEAARTHDIVQIQKLADAAQQNGQSDLVQRARTEWTIAQRALAGGRP